MEGASVILPCDHTQAMRNSQSSGPQNDQTKSASSYPSSWDNLENNSEEQQKQKNDQENRLSNVRLSYFVCLDMHLKFYM